MYISKIKDGGIMDLNERIRQLRLENKLTAKKLGNIFKVSESTISLYESGKRTPNKDLLIKMSDYFNVSTDYLLGKTDIPNIELHYNFTEKGEFDIAIEIEKILLQIGKNENVKFNDRLIDDSVRILLMKSLQVIVEALYLISNDNPSIINYKEDEE